MARRIGIGARFAVLIVLSGSAAWSAPCVSACRDEIAACHASECQGLRKKALRHCKRSCSKTLVRDCYVDLAVCGATTARPAKKPAGTGGSGGGGGGGGMTGGGW